MYKECLIEQESRSCLALKTHCVEYGLSAASFWASPDFVGLPRGTPYILFLGSIVAALCFCGRDRN